MPDAQILQALVDAAQRGVEVKIILPSVSDSWLVSQASHSFYAQMLQGGVRLYELKAAILHAKTAVIDGSWSTIGSTNLDTRSFLHNKEVNVVVMGDAFGQEMESAFLDDLNNSTEIHLPQWQSRGLATRFTETLARLLAYWL